MMLPADIQAYVLAQGIQPQGLLHQNDKSLVAWGMMGGRKVVIKALLSAEALWVDKFNFEMAVLKAFQAVLPPFHYAPLIRSGNGVLILGFMDGQQVTRDRYLETPLPQELLTATIEGLQQIADWALPHTHPFKPLDYAQKVSRYLALGLLTEDEADFIRQTLEAYQKPFVFQHGDVLLSNIIYQQNTAVFIDWEHAGLYLPGYDLALLHTLYLNDKATQQAIEVFAQKHGIWHPFLANKSVILAREIKQHQSLAENVPFKHKRLQWLHDEQTRHRHTLSLTCSD